MKLVIWPVAKLLLQAAAVDCYPHESAGWLLGYQDLNHLFHVTHVLPIQRADRRDAMSNVAHTSWNLTSEFVEDEAIGGFHTHPDDRAYMSNGDRADPDSGEVELVVPVRRGKRGWCMPFSRWRAYHQDANGRWHRIPVVAG